MDLHYVNHNKNNLNYCIRTVKLSLNVLRCELDHIGPNYEVQTNCKRKPRVIFESRSHMMSRRSIVIQIITI